MRVKALLLAAAGTVLLGLMAGCGTVGYYAQAVGGHLKIVHSARPVDEWLADPATPGALRAQLQLSRRLRDFAVRELALPESRSYRRYAALGRGAAVWNVVAAPELSLQLKSWCFAVVGCVGYRGFYDRAEADALAASLRAQGWEVDLYGVPAYSTLGRTEWLGGDPLLDTFIGWPEPELARILFHELAHHVVYVDDDTMFNESYATAVERLGLAQWLAREATPEVRHAHEAQEHRRRDFRALTLRARADLQALYASAAGEADKRRLKAERMAALRAEYAALKAGPWQGDARYDAWFERANNATLAVQAAYDELVPDFERLFEREGRDFARFHAAVRALAALPREQRRVTLQAGR